MFGIDPLQRREFHNKSRRSDNSRSMDQSHRRIADEIERFLRTGCCDVTFDAWPGRNVVERCTNGRDETRRALVDEVRRRAAGRSQRRLPAVDHVLLTRRKVEPMVRGLFPKAEQDAVLAVLERSVVFVTGDNVESLIRESDWSAWSIANLYLASVGAELLSEDAPSLVGLGDHMTCYVTPECLDEQPFADFIVHEAAHIFHNCKRATIGLRHTRQREWLLEIAFAKREVFAYSCEAYARIGQRAGSARERRRLAEEFRSDPPIPETEVDPDEIAEIVFEATLRRNGWKAILERCAPTRRAKHA